MTVRMHKAAGSLNQEVRHPKAEGYNIRIGTEWFRTISRPDVRPQLGTRDSLAQRLDNMGNQFNNVLDLGYAWGRTDLSGGEGLDWSPRPLALDQGQLALDEIRYWDSNGIDTSRPETEGDQYTLRLARTLQDWNPSGSPPTFVDLIDIGVSRDYIVIADNDTVYIFSEWGAGTPLHSAVLPNLATARAIAVSPSSIIMVAGSDGHVYQMRYPLETTFTDVYTPVGANEFEARGVWFAHARFIVSAFDGADRAALFALEWDDGSSDYGLKVDIDTASSAFWSVVESGPAVVAACGDGTVRTYTPDIGATTSTYALLPRGRTTMPEGEQPILLGSNAGTLLIVTSAATEAVHFSGESLEIMRAYQAEVLDGRFDYVVGQLQMRRQWTGATHEGNVVRKMANTRDEIFWWIRESFADTGGLQEALWRFDVVTNGLSRVVTADYDAQTPSNNPDINALVLYDNVGGAIDYRNNKIVITDPAKRQDFGWMIFPNITFGLNTPISWIATVVEAQDLVESGGQVELWRSTDPQAILNYQDPSWVLVQRLSSQGASNLEVPLVELESRTLSLQLRMYSTEGNTVTPRVTRTAIRGIPRHRDFIMMVPINVSDYVAVPGRRPQRIPGHGTTLHNKVLDLVGRNLKVLLIDPVVNFEGIINNVSEPIEYYAERGSVTTYVMAEFRGTRTPPSSSETPTGDDGVGLGLVGISTVGIGQTDIL